MWGLHKKTGWVIIGNLFILLGQKYHYSGNTRMVPQHLDICLTIGLTFTETTQKQKESAEGVYKSGPKSLRLLAL